MLQNVVFMFYVPALQLTTLHGHGNTTQLSPSSGSGAKAPLALLHSSGDGDSFFALLFYDYEDTRFHNLLGMKILDNPTHYYTLSGGPCLYQGLRSHPGFQLFLPFSSKNFASCHGCHGGFGAPASPSARCFLYSSAALTGCKDSSHHCTKHCV